MKRDLDDFYAQRTPSRSSTAGGVLKPGAAPEGEATAQPVERVIERPAGKRPAPAAPAVRTRAQLDQASSGLEHLYGEPEHRSGSTRRRRGRSMRPARNSSHMSEERSRSSTRPD